MVAPLLAAGLVSGGLGLLESALGIGKTAKAAKERKKAQSFFEANKYEIPEAAKGALSNAEKLAASGRLPYEDVTRAKMGEATATGVQAARNVGTSASDILTQMASLYANQQRQEAGLGIQAGQRYDTNQRYLGQALNTMAGYENQKWQYNVLYPYQQMMTAAGQMEGVGNQMISGGIGQIGGAAAGYMQGVGLDKELAAYKESLGYGNGSGTANPVFVNSYIDSLGMSPKLNYKPKF